MRPDVSGVWCAGDDRTASLASSRLAESADVSAALTFGAAKAWGGSAVLGLTLAGTIVALRGFVRSIALFDSAVVLFSAAGLTIGNGFAPANGPASASGFGSGFVSAVAVGVKGTAAAGLGGGELIGSAADPTLEPPVTEGAVAEAALEIGVGAGMAAAAGIGVGESGSTAVLDGIGSADRLASFTVAVVSDGSDFEAADSCGSPLRSVFDEPGGLDFAMLEGVLG